MNQLIRKIGMKLGVGFVTRWVRSVAEGHRAHFLGRAYWWLAGKKRVISIILGVSAAALAQMGETQAAAVLGTVAVILLALGFVDKSWRSAKLPESLKASWWWKLLANNAPVLAIGFAAGQVPQIPAVGGGPQPGSLRLLGWATLSRVKRLVDSLHARRWSHLAVANLRILLGFAFVPAGLKKVLYQPFTDPQNTGAFHDFLYAFYATGAFYTFVGGIQLIIAVLLMTQTFATLGNVNANRHPQDPRYDATVPPVHRQAVADFILNLVDSQAAFAPDFPLPDFFMPGQEDRAQVIIQRVHITA